MPLTDTMLRNVKSDGTPAKLADSEGLYLYLSASGGKLWRMDYRIPERQWRMSAPVHAPPLRLLLWRPFSERRGQCRWRAVPWPCRAYGAPLSRILRDTRQS